MRDLEKGEWSIDSKEECKGPYVEPLEVDPIAATRIRAMQSRVVWNIGFYT
jgi:hypothetical protein